VVTSISKPNRVLSELASGCRENGYPFWVIGDLSSPADFSMEGCSFFSVHDQLATGLRFAALCPTRHYARKNIGYLLAMHQGVQCIRETDDDNRPLDEFWSFGEPIQERPIVSGGGWINVYRYFSEDHIWPRGLPLDAVNAPPPPIATLPVAPSFCPIQQGLSDGNPDVDAVYRLLLPLPVTFKKAPGIVLARGAWCPFNSQNTTWFPEAFPLLYLPSYCSFRVTDIWRALVAQRICWENEWNVLFHHATVYQARNDHDLMRDFAEEVPAYLHNRRIAETLDSLSLRRGGVAVLENLLCCYEALIRIGVVDRQEIQLLESWMHDLREAGFPRISATNAT
jgi:hypothetical protein